MSLFRTLVVVLLVLPAPLLVAQKKDSVNNKTLDKRIKEEIIDAITRNSPQENVKNERSENAFLRYEGKIVRKIIITRLGFERSIYDSTKSIRNTVTKIANSLHRNTRKNILREHLFFHENKPLNPYLLADNERYLRDLDFILDSKINVTRVKGSRDSVDIEVVTRDVFSLGVRTRARGVDRFTVGAYEANFLGLGQRVQADVLFDNERNPVVGKSFTYTKSSVFGSLANLSLGYTELDNGRSVGEENEYAYYVRIDRPLVSPYSRMAGGFELSRNWSYNNFAVPDSLFRRYRYNVRDLWAGYNFGFRSAVADRNRQFVALRYYQQNYDRQPFQDNQLARRIYNDQRALLGEVTFYNQNFYKTNYIFGFGRTEDVPYGQTVNITGGWSEELGLRRTYLSSYILKRIVRPSGRFYDLEAGAGTFFNNDVSEDGVFYVNASYYSKLYYIEKSNIRHVFSGGYARFFNNKTWEILRLNNNHLRGFSPDSLFGFQRMFLRTETTVFMPGQLLGFRFAPFISLEGSLLKQKKKEEFVNDFFYGATGGLRIRNENLIFGTVEFRAFYFPTTVPGVSEFSFKVTTNVRIKYSGTFIRPPEFLRYN